MKIVYIGAIASTDSDIPLLRAFQQKGLDVTAYFEMTDWNKKGGIIFSENIEKRDALICANEIKAFEPYKKYIDLSKIFIINAFHGKRYQFQSWLLWLKVLKHIKSEKPDLIHYAWPQDKQGKLLYRIGCPKIITVHDPFVHKTLSKTSGESIRKKAFKLADKLVLLNSSQVSEFCKYYNIQSSKILLNKMGEFDYLKEIDSDSFFIKGEYLLFFGQIQYHKGVDILLKAMEKVHKKYPGIKLVIAGKGKIDYNQEKINKMDYVIIRNEFISVPELAALLKNCLFAICPYRDATQSGVVQTAFSANVPLVVTAVGALPEVVKNDIFGVVVEPNSSNAIYEGIIKILNDTSLLELYKNNINKIWRPSMKWDVIADKYIDCYKEILENEKENKIAIR